MSVLSISLLILLVLLLSNARSYHQYSEEEDHKTTTKMEDLVRVDFEVYGRVQGVFFRKYTQEEGERLGLRGFCRNTFAGTVSGTMEGPRNKVEQMKNWLRMKGSPMSRIEKAEFRNEAKIQDYSFQGSFRVERTM